MSSRTAATPTRHTPQELVRSKKTPVSGTPKAGPVCKTVIRDHHPEVPNLEAKKNALALLGPILPRPAQAAD
ncbi:hypothetical protein GCM10008957_25760 [Deinococcus ruber]|uniref:Uncharacterized protein n=1 Tax=Deinococcus ruber TaxID=1848197 RepID=A0A918C9J8_9DEIO|nr:hypothetical protein GCM10008957_25760 [Deinococcus ruber]